LEKNANYMQFCAFANDSFRFFVAVGPPEGERCVTKFTPSPLVVGLNSSFTDAPFHRFSNSRDLLPLTRENMSEAAVKWPSLYESTTPAELCALGCVLVLLLVLYFDRSSDFAAQPPPAPPSTSSSSDSSSDSSSRFGFLTSVPWLSPGKQKQKPGKHDPLRLSFVYEGGFPSVYKIEPNVSIKQVLKLYCAKFSLKHKGLVAKKNGRVLQMTESVLKQGLADMDTVSIEEDYKNLYKESTRKHTAEIRKRSSHDKTLEKRVREAKHIQDQLSKTAHALQTKLDASLAAGKQQAHELANHRTSIAKMERDVRTHAEQRKVAESALKEHASGKTIDDVLAAYKQSNKHNQRQSVLQLEAELKKWCSKHSLLEQQQLDARSEHARLNTLVKRLQQEAQDWEDKYDSLGQSHRRELSELQEVWAQDRKQLQEDVFFLKQTLRKTQASLQKKKAQQLRMHQQQQQRSALPSFVPDGFNSPFSFFSGSSSSSSSSSSRRQGGGDSVEDDTKRNLASVLALVD
jgi:hypothetical protein